MNQPSGGNFKAALIFVLGGFAFLALFLNWSPRSTMAQVKSEACIPVDTARSTHHQAVIKPTRTKQPIDTNGEADLAIVAVIGLHLEAPQIISQYHAVESFLQSARESQSSIEIILVLRHPAPGASSIPPWLQWPDLKNGGAVRFRAFTLTQQDFPSASETEAFVYGAREASAKRILFVRDLATLSRGVVQAALEGPVPSVAVPQSTQQAFPLHAEPDELLNLCDRAASGSETNPHGAHASISAAALAIDRSTVITAPASAAETDAALNGMLGLQLRLLLVESVSALHGMPATAHPCLSVAATNGATAHVTGSVPPAGALADYKPLHVHSRRALIADLSQLYIYGFNPEEPYTLFPHHLIFSHFLDKGWVGELDPNFIRDNLGLRTSYLFDCKNTQRYRLYHLSRKIPCDRFDLLIKLGANKYRADFPVMDEEYIEWIDDLSAAVEASKQRDRTLPYVGIELGARYGTWAGRAVKAFQTLRPQHPVIAVSVEADETGFNWLTQHGPNNGYTGDSWVKIKGGVSDRAGTTTFTGWEDNIARQVPLVTLTEILDKYEYVDIMHVDIQGAESVFPQFSELLKKKVRRLHFGTHSPQLHNSLIAWLRTQHWEVTFNLPGSFGGETTMDWATDYGTMKFVWDGILAAVNPHVPLPK